MSPHTFPSTTSQSDFAPLRSVLVRAPRVAGWGTKSVTDDWESLGFHKAPWLDRAEEEFGHFVQHLTSAGVDVISVDAGDSLTLDAIYVRDAAVVCDRGVILTRMGKASRGGEPAALRRVLERLAIPIVGEIEAPGCLEGGDVAWVDERTVAVGRGYRSNAAGIAQLRELLAPSVDHFVEVAMPHYRGPDEVFHLMSVYSPIDRDLALVHSPWMPIPLRELLLERGVELVEVPSEEFVTLGSNVLAIAPRVSLIATGNPITAGRLRSRGVEVIEFAGEEICVNGSGGPTCLTRPLIRGG